MSSSILTIEEIKEEEEEEEVVVVVDEEEEKVTLTTMEEVVVEEEEEEEEEKGRKTRSMIINPSMRLGTKANGFERKGHSWFVASELQSDLVVQVGEISFHLHKFPLISRSGRLNRLVFELTQKDGIQLPNMPGGADTFELAAKFCYGVAVELSAFNIAALRCAAEYLEMTEDLGEGNLISRTESFLSHAVLPSWKECIKVLRSCEDKGGHMCEWAERLKIIHRCCEAIAWRAALPSSDPQIPHNWWFEDVSDLSIEYFTKVINAVKAKAMTPDLTGAAVVNYAMKWLPYNNNNINNNKCISIIDNGPPELQATSQVHNISISLTSDTVPNDAITSDGTSYLYKNRVILERLICLLPPPHKEVVPCTFLLRLLRIANMIGANTTCKEDLERHAAIKLHQASLSDLLIPSFTHISETFYDVDLVQRMVTRFLQLHQQSGPPPCMALERGPGFDEITPIMKVAKLVDAYLAEIARDSNLTLTKFQSLADALPENARSCHDGLYRAIDMYFKAHPGLNEVERKKMCRAMDCQKLSVEACMHAAQNERLPLRVVVQVLFWEQTKLRYSNNGSTLTKEREEVMYNKNNNGRCGDGDGLEEIQVVKKDMDNMKHQFLELQRDYAKLQQQLERMTKLSDTTTTTTTNFDINTNQNNDHHSHHEQNTSTSRNGSSFPWSSGWKILTKFRVTQSSVDSGPRSTHNLSTSGTTPQQRPRRWRYSIS